MKRLSSAALLVYGRIYTHQRFYFAGQYKGYYRDAHKKDMPLTSITPNEWQALCDVINGGHSTLKGNICRTVGDENYMQAMAEKGKDNHLEPVPFTKEELTILQKVRKPSRGLFLFSHNNQEARPPSFYEMGYSLPDATSEFSKEQSLLVYQLIKKGVLTWGSKEFSNNNSYSQQVLFHT